VTRVSQVLKVASHAATHPEEAVTLAVFGLDQVAVDRRRVWREVSVQTAPNAIAPAKMRKSALQKSASPRAAANIPQSNSTVGLRAAALT
jgi:hypothetical protein